MKGSRSLRLGVVLLALAAPVAHAQPAFLVKDIRPGTADSYLFGPTTAGGVTFFFDNNSSLLRTDGTPGGTSVVKSGDVGSGGAELGGLLYFGFRGPDSGLWRSDGTAAGTVLVKAMYYEEVPWISPFGTNAAVLGGRLYFLTLQPSGHGLWVTDGSGAGTTKVKDFENPPVGRHIHIPYYLTAVGTRLFFTWGTDGVDGRELWTSDGTTAGTVRVADLNPGPAGSDPSSLVELGGELLFAASADGGAPRLWRSDGTAAGTVPVGSVRNVSALARLGNAVFFAAEEPGQGVELWRTDGTSAGTTLVADIDAGPGSSAPASLLAVGGTLFFVAHQEGTGREMWKTDGTAAGTVLVKDIRAGPSDSSTSWLTAAGGHLFFAANDGGGSELWKSDGTAAGTVLLADVNPGSSAEPSWLAALGSGVVFVATDGIHGYELWYGGAAGGATLLMDHAAGPASSDPRYPVDVNGRLYFSADDDTHGREVWVSDGSQAGTRLVRDINPGAASSRGAYGYGYEYEFYSEYIYPYPDSARAITALGATAFFAADNGTHGAELWKTDGTEGGTVLVKDINPGGASSGPRWLVPLGTVMLFVAEEPSTGGELWRSDGTAAGTFLVRDIRPGPASSFSRLVAISGGRVFLFADDGVHGRELWVSDGTSGGTRLVKDIRLGLPESIHHLSIAKAVGEVVYFNPYDDIHGFDLWRSDGTEEGTFMVRHAPGQIFVDGMWNAQGRLFFTVNFYSWGLWASDGSSAGTVMLSDRNGFDSVAPLGSDVLFGSISGSDRALWRSDGTLPGTRLVKDLAAGGEVTRAFQPAGGGVIFCASSANPQPTWWSDGTEEGTFEVDANRCPYAFTLSGSSVFFRSDYGSPEGQELWAIPLAAMTAVRVSDCSVSEGQSGPRTCPFTVSLSSALTTPVTLSYATADGTALAGSDYVAASGTLTFAPGATAQTIPVTVNGDATPEVSEGFSLALSSVSGAVLVDGDAAGTILDDEASRFHALPPCRLVDTRGPAGPAGGPPLGAGRTRSFTVTGSCGVPASAKTVAVNLTVVNPGDAGNLRAYPAGLPAPPTSVVNFAAGRTRANNAVLAVGLGGAITVQCDMAPGSIAKAHLVMDVAGYFE